MPEQKVEKWKITPEMKGFLKEYKKLRTMGEVLGQAYEIQLGEAEQTRAMLKEVEGTKQLMLQSTPEHPAYELEGQDMEIRY